MFSAEPDRRGDQGGHGPPTFLLSKKKENSKLENKQVT